MRPFLVVILAASLATTAPVVSAQTAPAAFEAALASPIRTTEDRARDTARHAAETLAFLRTHIPEAQTVPLCGNSIGTDRRFLAAYMPDIEQFLHYRSVDVSTLKELIKRWNPALLSDAPKKAEGHRALDDIRESVAELRYYRDSFCRLAG